MAANELSESEVIAWLERHTDIFRRRPELLDSLQLPHETGAASLIERQVERLRGENRHLQQQLHELAAIAGENERLMHRLHQLTLELMRLDGNAEFIERLVDRLAEDFRADAVRLHLLDVPDELEQITPVVAMPASLPDWVQRLLDDGQIEFGRLTRAKLDYLFPDHAGEIASAALLPIADTGLLAIGAGKVERFQPGMGTLFLELLGRTIRFRLHSPGAEQRKRA